YRWTLHPSNPDRVSFATYARAVDRSPQAIEKSARRYEASLPATVGTTAPVDNRGGARTWLDRAEAADSRAAGGSSHRLRPLDTSRAPLQRRPASRFMVEYIENLTLDVYDIEHEIEALTQGSLPESSRIELRR